MVTRHFMVQRLPEFMFFKQGVTFWNEIPLYVIGALYATCSADEAERNGLRTRHDFMIAAQYGTFYMIRLCLGN